MMIVTCNDYIHEYSMFDDVIDCINESVKDINMAMARHQMKLHQLESKLLFEAADEKDVKIEKKKSSEGVLAKIGNAVLALINKITGFIGKFTEKLTGNIKVGKSDEEKVTKILADHPDLKDQVMKGIKNEWFTVADVAQFEKDVIGLINMLEKNAIDHATFMDKFKGKCQAFADSARPIVDATTTVIKMVNILPEIHKAAKGSKEAISSFKGTLEKFKDDVDHNYAEKDVNKVHAIWNALGQAIGLCTKDANHNAAMRSRWSGVLNGAVGKFLHVDDASRDKRHREAFDKRVDKKTKATQREQARIDATDILRGNVKRSDPSLDDDTINNTIDPTTRKTK